MGGLAKLWCVAFSLLAAASLPGTGAETGRGRGRGSMAEERAERYCRQMDKELRLPARKKIIQRGSEGKWWMWYWDPNWSCPTEEKIGLEASDRGQDGEKWVCDTDLLVRGGCLVYSFGSHSNFMFEKGMSSRFQCEIHTFDPFLVKKVPELEGVDVRLHAWGLAEETRQQPMPSRRGMPKKGVPDMLFLKSLPDIIEALGHTGRKIDVLKLDVEGFEFGVLDNHTMWRDVARLGTSVSQVLVEVHSKGINRQTFSWRNASVYEGRDMDNLFRVMSDQGYGIFHKEINTFPTANLLCAEFGFVKLGIKCSKSKRPQSDAEKFSSSVLNPGSEEVKRKRAILTDVSEFVY